MDYYSNGFIVCDPLQRNYANESYNGICAYKRIKAEKGFFVTDINMLSEYPFSRILYIESDYDKEQYNGKTDFEKTFLGYEAFSLTADSFPVHELYVRSYFECYRQRLNQHGLISDEWHAFRYCKDYRSFLSLNLLGNGWTDIYFGKVYEVKNIFSKGI